MPYLLILFRRQHWQRYRFLLQQVDIRRTLMRAGLYLVVVFGLHSWIMVEFEGLWFDEAIWMTLTTVVTGAMATTPQRRWWGGWRQSS